MSTYGPARRVGSSYMFWSSASTPDRWSLYLPAAFLVFVVLWWECFPVYPGPCLAGAAFALVLLLIRKDIAPRGEQLFWAAAAVFMFAAEARVSYRAHTEAQTFLVARFSDKDRISMQVHGRSDIHSAFVFVTDLDRFNILQNMRIEDGAQYEGVVQPVPLGEFSPNGSARSFAAKQIQTPDGVAHYRMTFYAANGLWWEDLQVARIAGRPVTALRVLRYWHLKPTILLEEVDGAFPRNAADQVDWSWATRQP